MNRRRFVMSASVVALTPLVIQRLSTEAIAAHGEIDKIQKTEAEWREILTKQEFYILREEGTEQRRTSELNDEKRAGTYICAGCELALFKSEWKYDSGTGWPSFYRVMADHIKTKTDFKMVWPRTEYHCARCGGHQGHVFDDGPEPTGKRWCNNGAALDFVPS